MLNGADVVEFDRNDRRLMLALAVLVPIYVLAFYTGNFAFRAVGGTALHVAIAWLVWWVWQRYLGGEDIVPCAMGVIEWRALGTRDLPRAGVVQVVALLTQIVAVAAFVVRIWPRALRVAWLGGDPARHISAAAIWVVGALLLFIYIVFTFIQVRPARPGDYRGRATSPRVNVGAL